MNGATTRFESDKCEEWLLPYRNRFATLTDSGTHFHERCVLLSPFPVWSHRSSSTRRRRPTRRRPRFLLVLVRARAHAETVTQRLQCCEATTVHIEDGSKLGVVQAPCTEMISLS